MSEEDKQEYTRDKIEYERRVLQNENECYEYKLVGVNIHVGTADAGHYYSYINTDRFSKDESNEEWGETHNDKWMEFNDSVVSDYNFDDFKADCYGGSKEDSGGDSLFSFFKSSGYGKSAYVLVYEKREKDPIKLVVPEEGKSWDMDVPAPISTLDGSEGEAKTVTAVDYRNYGGKARQVVKVGDENMVEIPMKEIGMHVQNDLFRDVWEDNNNLFFERLIYSKEFYEFVKELMVGTRELNKKKANLMEDQLIALDKASTHMVNVGSKLVLQYLK